MDAFFVRASISLAFLWLTVLLLRSHSVMGFSDPNHWIYRAEGLFRGEPHLRRVLLFPFFVGLAHRLLGGDFVFLSNLPFVLLLSATCGWMTLRIFSKNGEVPKAWVPCAFLVGAFSLPFFQIGRMSTLLNPYRDAGGISLFLLGWVFFARSEKTMAPRSGFLAAFFCAASVGFREAMMVAGLPLGLWVLARVVSSARQRKTWIWVFAMWVGFLAGMIPTFYQNWKYSGFFFLPAYSAGQVVVTEEILDDGEEGDAVRLVWSDQIEQRLGDAEQVRIDMDAARIIPGARPEYFQRTFQRTRRRIRGYYGGWPFVFLLVALGTTLYRRNAFALAIILPTFVLTFLFYSFYRYVNWRYVFFLHVLIVPWIAAGFLETLRFLFSLLPGKPPRDGRVLLLGTMVCVFGWGIHYWNQVSPNRTYAWNLSRFRASLQPYLQEPRVFLGFRHHRQMLAWYLDHDFNHAAMDSQVDPEVIPHLGLETALAQAEEEVRNSLGEQHLYVHGIHDVPVLFPLWADVKPVVRLSGLPVILYRYSRPVNGTLYEIVPWQQSETTFAPAAPPPPDRPAALLFNPRRLWDNPARERAELWFGDELLLPKVENGPQFVMWPETKAEDTSLSFTLRGDLPVPSKVPTRLWEQNQPLLLEFGMRPDWWFPELLSEELQRFTLLRRDACQFIDRADFRLPAFADEDHDVFAEFRVEFYQEDPDFRHRHFYIGTGDGPLDVRHPLPQRRGQGRVVVPLGPGNGSLEFREASLSSALPAYETQRQNILDGSQNQVVFIKAFDVRIFSVPRHTGGTFTWTAGAADSGAWLLGGMWDPERHQGRYPVRWTDGRGRVRLPATLDREKVLTLTLRYFPAPLETGADEPSLELNGQDLQLTLDARAHDPETGLITLVYKLPPASLPETGESELAVVSPSWRPVETTGAPDHRQLGVMLHQVEVGK